MARRSHGWRGWQVGKPGMLSHAIRWELAVTSVSHFQPLRRQYFCRENERIWGIPEIAAKPMAYHCPRQHVAALRNRPTLGESNE
jgi:hypothetical protein